MEFVAKFRHLLTLPEFHPPPSAHITDPTTDKSMELLQITPPPNYGPSVKEIDGKDTYTLLRSSTNCVVDPFVQCCQTFKLSWLFNRTKRQRTIEVTRYLRSDRTGKVRWSNCNTPRYLEGCNEESWHKGLLLGAMCCVVLWLQI